MTVSSDALRETLSFLPCGVTVVTSRFADGAPAGLTATSVCSVSLRPPLVLACLEREAETYRAVTESGAFALNLLDETQGDLARRFAADGDKFRGVAYDTKETGVPILEAAVAYCDCTVAEVVPAGDHEIFVGKVRGARVVRPGGRGPLIRYLGEYRALRERLGSGGR